MERGPKKVGNHWTKALSRLLNVLFEYEQSVYINVFILLQLCRTCDECNFRLFICVLLSIFNVQIYEHICVWNFLFIYYQNKVLFFSFLIRILMAYTQFANGYYMIQWFIAGIVKLQYQFSLCRQFVVQFYYQFFSSPIRADFHYCISYLTLEYYYSVYVLLLYVIVDDVNVIFIFLKVVFIEWLL